MNISVIMGVYNADKDMLEKAVLSIINQTYKDFEFIICDDGSDNITYFWLLELKQLDKRIILLRNSENKGLAFTLNRCISAAKGSLLIRQDADDCSAPNRIQTIADFHEQNPQYDIISSNIALFDDTGVWGHLAYPQNPQSKDFLFCIPFMHGASAFKKQSVLNAGGYRVANETRRTEDIDLFMRMYVHNGKGYTIQENLYSYREDQKAQSKRKFRYKIDEAIVKYKGFRELHLMPVGIIFVVKPLFVGILPRSLLSLLKDIYYKRRFNI